MKKSETIFFTKSQILSSFTHLYTPLENGHDAYFQIPGFGEAHRKGLREFQEDASLFVRLSTAVELSKEQVAQRLWTTIKIIDEQVKAKELGMDEGCTACVAYLSQDFLITANLADSVLFVVLFNPQGEPLGVARLTEYLHHPTDSKEQKRIIAQGAMIKDRRVNGRLALARAIGDHDYNTKGEVLISDAEINIYSLNQLQAILNPQNLPAGEMKCIMTCDGFTEAADIQFFDHHEFLRECLCSINKGYAGKLQEGVLAEKLTKAALENYSGDNISVSVFTINQAINNTTYFAIFDGHGGKKVADYAVKNFADTFNTQLGLNEIDYQQQPLSTSSKKEAFLNDNSTMETDLGLDKVAFYLESTPEELQEVKRELIETGASKLAECSHAFSFLLKIKNFIPNNIIHNKQQEIESVQFIFIEHTNLENFQNTVEKLSGQEVIICRSQKPYVAALSSEIILEIDLDTFEKEINQTTNFTI
jgi:serine/threonine protein phosphatase PrpC